MRSMSVGACVLECRGAPWIEPVPRPNAGNAWGSRFRAWMQKRGRNYSARLSGIASNK